MKISHDVEGADARVEISGDLDSAKCNCLEAFWRCHMPDDLTSVTLALGDLDLADGASTAVLVNLIRSHLARGARVTIHGAPQMLAHTLYKADLIRHRSLALIDPRHDEQPHEG